MKLPLQSFDTLVQGMAASVQAAATQLLDLSVGSALRAIMEASASVALWMQWLILLVLQTTRAATSSGPDLDSWMADFSLTRLPASASSGVVTFSRYTATLSALVPLGALVRTVDGSETFSVVADSSAGGWSASLNGYLIPAGTGSLDVPVAALVAGSGGNVQAGAINVLATAMAGVDAVSNSAAFTNGCDAESDPAFRLRFQTFISSLSRATLAAVGNAINSVQQQLNYAILENQDAAGNAQPGSFVVVVDDGSGYPSDALLSLVQQAIEAVRPVGSTFAVFPPAVIQVNVSLSVALAGGLSAATVTPQIIQALDNYVNTLPIGAPLPITKVSQLAYNANVGIVNVTEVLLNGQSNDAIAGTLQVLKVGTVTVS